MTLNKVPFLFQVKGSLGPLELEVMKIVWKNQRTTVRKVVNILRQRKSVAYTTAMTVMGNLYKKDFLKREKIGKSYYYSPAQRESYIIGISLSGVFRNLSADYGRGRVLYSIFAAGILPKINITIIPPRSGKIVRTYRAPVGLGISFAFLLAIFSLSAYDLFLSFRFFRSFDYLSLLKSDLTFSVEWLKLFVLAFIESLPVVNILTTVVSLILVIVLAKKLAKLLKFENPQFINMKGAIR